MRHGYTKNIFKKIFQFDIRYKSCGPISFTCDDPEKTVHFKFDRFHTEYSYDFLFIDNLELTGYQQTDIWVNAESISDFDIYFHRRAFELRSRFL